MTYNEIHGLYNSRPFTIHFSLFSRSLLVQGLAIILEHILAISRNTLVVNIIVVMLISRAGVVAVDPGCWEPVCFKVDRPTGNSGKQPKSMNCFFREMARIH